MKECDFLLTIDNKEILTEILNQAIDYLIGNQDEQQTMRMCHKYGFHNPDDFLLATKRLAKLYQQLCCSEAAGVADSKMELTQLTPELQTIMLLVLNSRRPEVLRFLIRAQNSSEFTLVEWFDWSTNLILGDSSFASNTKLLTTVTLNLRKGTNQKKGGYQTLHFQMDRAKLDELITCMEQMISNCEQNSEID